MIVDVGRKCFLATVLALSFAVPVAAQPVAVAIAQWIPRGSWGTPCQHVMVPGTDPLRECPAGPLGPGFLNPPAAGPNGRIFKTLHLALIPQPAANAGLVLGWDSQNQSGAGGSWSQRWTILDPSTDPPTVLWNDELDIPGATSGNLFCSGHAWMPDGRLLIVGGTAFYPGGSGLPFGGAQLALIFDPGDPSKPFGNWTILPVGLATDRWYPTVTLLGDGSMMVSGGVDDGNARNSYELYDPVTGTWLTDIMGNRIFAGPTGAASFPTYPRMHVLSDGLVFESSPKTTPAKADAAGNPGVWTNMATSSVHRHDGASILFPRNYGKQDRVWILGGSAGSGHATAHRTVQSIHPKNTLDIWKSQPSMKRPRVHPNAVLLPDRTVLVLGGNDTSDAGDTFWKDGEWFYRGAWRPMRNGASVRDYHSTAVLLPSAKVLSAGGNNRDWDYQLFSPPYFDLDRVRPRNLALNTSQIQYQVNGATTYTATFTALPTGRSIKRVVLLASGSTTHHSDMGQRFVDLRIVSQTASSVVFEAPVNSCAAPNPNHSCAPPQYYQFFVVTDQDMPSSSLFVPVG